MTSFFPVAILLCLSTGPVLAQSNSEPISIRGVPENLHWLNNPVKWSYLENKFVILAGPKTDLFVDPQHAYTVTNSPKAVFLSADSFLLSARVSLNFKTDYDAGVLVVYAGETSWAKLCFEFSPQKKPFVVSVVNNGISDDCNHVPIQGNQVYFRIAGLGNHIYAFHYSSDGKKWSLARYFMLDTKLPVYIGFSSQSPTGLACQSTFTSISYQITKLQDLRNGE